MCFSIRCIQFLHGYLGASIQLYVCMACGKIQMLICVFYSRILLVYILERGFQLFSLMFPCNVSSYDYNLHVKGILPVNLPEQC